jgi:hypothetical protein
MNIKWCRRKANNIEIHCPCCKHRAAPHDYPYCEHTIFVYVEPAADDPGFDYVTPEFAIAYLAAYRSRLVQSDDQPEIDPVSEACFTSGSLPAIHNQVIRLYEELLSQTNVPEKASVYDVTESGGYYPTRVIVGFKED